MVDRLGLPAGSVVDVYKNCIAIKLRLFRDRQHYLKPGNGLMGELCSDCLTLNFKYIRRCATFLSVTDQPFKLQQTPIQLLIQPTAEGMCQNLTVDAAGQMPQVTTANPLKMKAL